MSNLTPFHGYICIQCEKIGRLNDIFVNVKHVKNVEVSNKPNFIFTYCQDCNHRKDGAGTRYIQNINMPSCTGFISDLFNKNVEEALNGDTNFMIVKCDGKYGLYIPLEIIIRSTHNTYTNR